MNCQEVIEFMQRQLDGDLNAQEEAQLADHLKHCSDCPEMYQRLKQLSNELTNLPKVVPAYSLVDAIMPRLFEIDKQNAANSPSDPNTDYIPAAQEPRSIPRTRRFGSSFSWKAAGGVIAAGLVLGIFLFQTNNSSSDQADGLLQPRNNGKTASSAAGSQSADSNKNSANTDKLNSVSPNGNEPAASAQNRVGNPPLNGSNSTGPSPTENSAQPSQNPKSHDVSKDIKPDQKVITGATATNGNSASPSAAPTASASAKGQESSGSQASESPAITGDPKTKDQSGSTVQPSPAAANASPSPAPDQAGTHTMSITSLMPEETLRSKDGKYLAAIEQHKVTIKDQASQEIIFTSERVWIETDKVTLLEWSDDGKLTYQVINDTSTQNFEIDAVHKSEALLK
jgi:hypothetical protein